MFATAGAVDGSVIEMPVGSPFQFLPTVLPKLDCEIASAALYSQRLLASGAVTVVNGAVPVDCRFSGAWAKSASRPPFCVKVPMFCPRLEPGMNMSIGLKPIGDI